MRWRLLTLAALVAALGCHSRPSEPSDAGAGESAAPSRPWPPPPLPADSGAALFAMRAQRQAQIHARLNRPSAKGKPANDQVLACMRNAKDWDDLHGCLSSVAAPDAGALKFASGAVPSPVPPAQTSWLIPHWEWNASTGSNKNTGVDSAHPLHDEMEILSRWQTANPILLQGTAVVSQVDDATESTIFDPIIGPGGSFSVLPATTTVFSGTLGTVTAKDRTRVMTACPDASCPFLQATWTGISTAQQGLLIVNSTHPGVAWVHDVVGSTAILTQPFAANVPAFATFPAEVDTWTIGDSFTLVRPSQLRIGSFNPTIATGDVSGDSYFAFLGRGWVTDPSGTPGNSYVNISRLVRIAESRIDAYYSPSSTSGGFDGTIQNSWLPGLNALNAVDLQGGGYGSFGGSGATTFSGIVDGDAIFDSNLIVQQNVLNVSNVVGYVGFNGVVHAGGIQLEGDTAIVGDAYGGNGVVYGQYQLTAYNTTASVGYFSTAVATFLGAPLLTCQLSAFANAVDRTLDYEHWIPARALTPALLDLSVAAGGFGGSAYCDSGSTFHNLTQTTAAPAKWVNDVPHGGTGLDAGCPTGQALGQTPLACFTPAGSGASCPINLATCTTGNLPVASIAPCGTNGQILQTISGVQTCVNPSSFTLTNIVPNGLTGDTTFPPNALLYGNGVNPIQTTGPGTSGLPYVSNGSSSPPTAQQISLASAVSNCLPVGNCGTGLTSCGSGQIVTGGGGGAPLSCVTTIAPTSLTPGGNGQWLGTNSSFAPQWFGLTGTDLLQNPTVLGNVVVTGIRGENVPNPNTGGISTFLAWNANSSGVFSWVGDSVQSNPASTSIFEIAAGVPAWVPQTGDITQFVTPGNFTVTGIRGNAVANPSGSGTATALMWNVAGSGSLSWTVPSAPLFNASQNNALSSINTFVTLATLTDTAASAGSTYTISGTVSCPDPNPSAITYGLSLNSTTSLFWGHTASGFGTVTGGIAGVANGSLNYSAVFTGTSIIRLLAKNTVAATSHCDGDLTIVRSP